MYVAIWRASALLAALGTGAMAEASGCRGVEHAGASYTVCEADPASDDIRLMLDADDGKRIGTFERLDGVLERAGRRAVFAMNGGMYHADRRPVGLYVEEGRERAPIVTRDGPGNFGLLPNGVFCLSDGRASIIESRAFAEAPPGCRFASQSGPMLVIDGALHPRFIPNGSSRYVRNGVGVTRNGKVVAAISNEPVNFHDFATLFREALDAPDALYLDGNVSRLYAPGIGRRDIGFPMGPMLVVTEAAD